MPGSEEDRTATDWRTESRFYRRRPGAGWLVAFLAIPALLALIGWGGLNGSHRAGGPATPSVASSATLTLPAAAPSTPAVAAPAARFSSWSITRDGTGLTMSGALPDEDTRSGLVNVLQQALPGVPLKDQLTVTPGVASPDAAGLGGLFDAIGSIPDFALKLDGDTLTLTGTAPSEAIKASAERDAMAAFPNVKVVNDIQVSGAAPSSAPAPAPGGPCATLQADITGLLKTPITFVTDGSSLAADSKQLVGRIADTVKACPSSKLAVIGHTDNTGNDAINVPLSAARAKAVADELISDGVASDGVTSSGAGSGNPVASNATPDGRAQNRRVEITVS